MFRSGTYYHSKNCPVFVSFGAACVASAIRPYDRACAILQKMDLFSFSLGPPVRRIQYAPTAGYVRSFKIPMLFPNRVRAALQKTVLFSSLFGAACGAYSIHSYDWVRAALRKTTPFSSPSGPLVGRMRYSPTIGYVRFFKIPMQFLN